MNGEMVIGNGEMNLILMTRTMLKSMRWWTKLKVRARRHARVLL